MTHPLSPVLALLGMGPLELGLVLALVLLLFGPASLPEAARRVGRLRARLAEVQQEFEAEARRAEIEADYRANRGVSAGTPQTSREPEDERARLEQAARVLGLDAAGLSDDEIRQAIRRRTE